MSNKWKTQETRCISRNLRDRKQCKIQIAAGNYLCEHHKFDLAAIANDPSSCIKLMTERFPKRHHPACDQKGENDCDCHDYSPEAHALMTLKKGFEQSKLLSPLYKKHLRLTMKDKIRRIKRYYHSITEDDLYLPPYPNFRQYRFFCWEPKTQRILVKVLKDTVRNKTIMLSHLRRLAPLHVYYTTGQWLNPQGIGPDPESRKGAAKMRKKGWCSPSKKITLKRYHNTLIKRDLYFDVDYDNKDYHQGIQMLTELWNGLDELKILGDSEVQIVFSGGKGFHLIANGYYDEASIGWIQMVYTNKKTPVRIWEKHGDYSLRKHVNTPDKNQQIQNHYMEVVKYLRHNRPSLLLDWMVTWDNRRIIRLPGTVHGKTLRVCKEITLNDESVMRDPRGRVIGYNPDPCIP
jgi:DNA primase catalytic subunit